MRKLLLLCAIMLVTVGAWAQDISLLDQTAPVEFDQYSRPAEGVYAIKMMSKGYTGWMYNEGATYRMTTSATLGSLPKSYLWKVTHLDGENLGSFTLTCLNNDVALTAQTTSHNIHNTQSDAVTAILKGERNWNVESFEGINIYQRNYTAEQMTQIGDATKPYIHTNDGNNSFRYLSYWVGGFNSNATTGTACVFQFYRYSGIEYTLTDDAGNQYSSCVMDQTKDAFNLASVVSGVEDYEISDVEWVDNKIFARIHFPVPVSKADGSADRNVLMNPFTSDNSLRYFVDGNNVKVHTLSDNTVNNNDLWSIYPEFNDGSFTFVIKNYGTGRYVKVNKTESSGNTNDAGAVTVVDAFADATKFTLAANNKFKLPNLNLYMSVTSSTASSQYVTVHTAIDHNGCDIYFPEVSNEMVGNWKEVYKGFLGYVGGYPASSAEDLDAVTTYADMLAFQAENEILGIDPDKYYHLVCKSPKTDNNGDTSYNTLTFDGTSNLVTAPEDNSKVNQMFKFKPIEDGKYMLVSPNTGRYLNKIDQGGYRSALVDEGSACKLEIIAHAGVICQYKLHNSESTNSNHCLFAENHPGETVPYACSGWDNGANSASAWYLKVVDKLNFVIGSAGWATAHLPFDVVMPETVKAYAVESTSAESAALTEKGDIPAGQGAILEGQGTHTLTIAKASSDWTGNKLEGTNVDEQITGSAYVLSMPEGKDVGLYPAKLTNGQFKNNANKAYLPASVVASDARFLIFSFGDDMETGITETENEEVKTENTVVYDLNGRRAHVVQKGIFIVNGVKFVR